MSSGSNQSLRVMVFTDAAAQIVPRLHRLLTANGHKLVGVVTGPGPKSRRSDAYVDIVRATPPGIDVIVTSHPQRLVTMLRPFNADLFWVVGFMRILPDDVINLPRLGTVNTHGGILPRYRGPNPPGWCFRNDEGRLGWTVHRMTEVVDGGPILAQASIPYGDDDDFESMFPRWAGIVPELLQRALDRIVAGDPGDPQDESQAGYAGLFEPAWREIDWSQPSRAIHNQVRSWVGERSIRRGAFGEIDGIKRLIIKTQLVPGEAVPDVSPGTVIGQEGETLLVRTGDGPLRVLRWQPVDDA